MNCYADTGFLVSLHTTTGQVAPLDAALEITAQSSIATPLWLESSRAAGESGGPAFAAFATGPELVGRIPLKV